MFNNQRWHWTWLFSREIAYTVIIGNAFRSRAWTESMEAIMMSADFSEIIYVALELDNLRIPVGGTVLQLALPPPP